MDRNLRRVNGMPYQPTLSCLNRIGPFEVSLIANEMTTHTGDKTTSAAALPTTSIILLTERGNHRESFCSNKSGYRVGSTPPGRSCWTPSSGKKWKEMSI